MGEASAPPPDPTVSTPMIKGLRSALALVSLEIRIASLGQAVTRYGWDAGPHPIQNMIQHTLFYQRPSSRPSVKSFLILGHVLVLNVS